MVNWKAMKWAQQKSGFTIVELLIVVVVIAILAAITIVSYNGITSRANDASVRTDLSNFGKIMELYQADNGEYPATLTASMGIRFSKGLYGADYQSYNIRYCRNASTNQYILLVNLKDGRYYRVINGSGVQATSSTYGYGVCSQIGLSNTNPSHNGYNGTSDTWASWVN